MDTVRAEKYGSPTSGESFIDLAATVNDALGLIEQGRIDKARFVLEGALRLASVHSKLGGKVTLENVRPGIGFNRTGSSKGFA